MKTFADDRWDREVELFSSFRTLWKTENEEWVEARKQAWKAAHAEQGGDPWTLAYGKFYVYGEEPPRCFVDGRGHETDSGFEIQHRIAYTPFARPDDLLRFWEVMQQRYPGSVTRDHRKFLFVGDMLDQFPERDEKLKMVTETMFRPDLFMQFAEVKTSEQKKLATIDPLEFAIHYTWLSNFYYKNNRHEYDYRNFCHDYFMLCMHYCEENKDLDTTTLVVDLYRMYELLVALDDTTLSPLRLELKQKLISEAGAENAPAMLSEALKAAQKSDARWSFYDGHKQYLKADRVEPRPRLRKPNLPG